MEDMRLGANSENELEQSENGDPLSTAMQRIRDAIATNDRQWFLEGEFEGELELEIMNLAGLQLTSDDLEAILNSAELRPYINSVRVLNLSINSLDRLPDNLASFNNLNFLALGANRINVFPSILSNMPNLECLDLSYNALSTIEDDLSGMRELTDLYLSGNVINPFPTGLFGLSNLSVLNLSYNQIHDFPANLEPQIMPNLESLNMNHNPVNQNIVAMQEMRNAFSHVREFSAALITESSRATWPMLADELPLFDNLKLLELIQGNHAGLKEFLDLANLTNNVRIEGLRYAFKKLTSGTQEEKEMIFSNISVATGNCATPIHDTLTRFYIQKCKENNEVVPKAILLREAIKDLLSKKSQQIRINSPEKIEIINGFLNAIFLENANKIDNNPFKIINSSQHVLESETDNQDFAFLQITDTMINNVAPLICVQNENGEFVKNNNCYVLDEYKMEDILEDYQAKVLGEPSEKYKLLQATEGKIYNKIQTDYSYLLDQPWIFPDHVKNLKKLLFNIEPEQYKDVCERYCNEFFQRCENKLKSLKLKRTGIRKKTITKTTEGKTVKNPKRNSKSLGDKNQNASFEN